MRYTKWIFGLAVLAMVTTAVNIASARIDEYWDNKSGLLEVVKDPGMLDDTAPPSIIAKKMPTELEAVPPSDVVLVIKLADGRLLYSYEGKVYLYEPAKAPFEIGDDGIVKPGEPTLDDVSVSEMTIEHVWVKMIAGEGGPVGEGDVPEIMERGTVDHGIVMPPFIGP